MNHLSSFTAASGLLTVLLAHGALPERGPISLTDEIQAIEQQLTRAAIDDSSITAIWRQLVEGHVCVERAHNRHVCTLALDTADPPVITEAQRQIDIAGHGVETQSLTFHLARTSTITAQTLREGAFARWQMTPEPVGHPRSACQFVLMFPTARAARHQQLTASFTTEPLNRCDGRVTAIHIRVFSVR